MNHAEHSKALQAEIINYRLVLDSIRMLCQFRTPIQPGPLVKLVGKALEEPHGQVIVKEYSLLRVLEALDRAIMEQMNKPPEVKVNVEELVRKKEECLKELIKLREEAQARAKIITPESGILRV